MEVLTGIEKATYLVVLVITIVVAIWVQLDWFGRRPRNSNPSDITTFFRLDEILDRQRRVLMSCLIATPLTLTFSLLNLFPERVIAGLVKYFDLDEERISDQVDQKSTSIATPTSNYLPSSNTTPQTSQDIQSISNRNVGNLDKQQITNSTGLEFSEFNEITFYNAVEHTSIILYLSTPIAFLLVCIYILGPVIRSIYESIENLALLATRFRRNTSMFAKGCAKSLKERDNLSYECIMRKLNGLAGDSLSIPLELGARPKDDRIAYALLYYSRRYAQTIGAEAAISRVIDDAFGGSETAKLLQKRIASARKVPITGIGKVKGDNIAIVTIVSLFFIFIFSYAHIIPLEAIKTSTLNEVWQFLFGEKSDIGWPLDKSWQPMMENSIGMLFCLTIPTALFIIKRREDKFYKKINFEIVKNSFTLFSIILFLLTIYMIILRIYKFFHRDIYVPKKDFVRNFSESFSISNDDMLYIIIYGTTITIFVIIIPIIANISTTISKKTILISIFFGIFVGIAYYLYESISDLGHNFHIHQGFMAFTQILISLMLFQAFRNFTSRESTILRMVRWPSSKHIF